MRRKNLVIAIILTALFTSQSAFADDIDIYGVSQINVKPNVLIVFDNSGSMGTKDVPGEVYDSDKDYTITGSSYIKNQVYYNSYGWKDYFTDDLNTSSDWQCAAAKQDLLEKGYWSGYLRYNNGVVTCGGRRWRTLRIGNFLNFDEQDLGDKKTRMEVAKEVIAKLIYDKHKDVRFGVMKFNAHTPYSYNQGTDDKKYESGYVVSPCDDNNASKLIGSWVPGDTLTNSNQSNLYGAIGGMVAQTYTPLAETMVEAGLYFAGETSWFNGKEREKNITDYDTDLFPLGGFSGECAGSGNNCFDYSTNSPVQYRCQNNYIILMTDGSPYGDKSNRLRDEVYIQGLKITSYNKNGSYNYLDDIAYFLKHTDLMPLPSGATDEDKEKYGEPGDFEEQTVTTYTIGFKKQLPLLQDAADNGGGEYYTADNASTLNEALNNIISSIAENNEGFSAASVPVSRANRAYAGNYVYYGLFQPENSGDWIGNIKKYLIDDSGVIKDVNGNEVVSGSTVVENAQSYWSSKVDGPSVGRGGAGQVLYDRLESGSFTRNIYTYTGTDKDLTDTTNQFSSTNTLLTNGTTYPTLTDSVIGAVRSEDGDWPYSSFLHSQPIVAHYDDDNDGTDDHSIIYVGSNGGMLHAIDDKDGMELWGYVPDDLLNSLSPLENTSSLNYYVDGTPIIDEYESGKQMIIFGERRGGQSYTALDITDYNSPKYMYSIGRDFLGTGEEKLGQSWSEFKKVKLLNNDVTPAAPVEVFLMSGGYDDNQDLTTSPAPAANDSFGRAVFAVERKSGQLFDDFMVTANTYSDMTHSIIAVAGFENPKSRNTTRIYAGDLNGNIFAFRDDKYHRNKDKDKASSYIETYNGKNVEMYDGIEDGNWDQKITLFSVNGQKIFYEPEITYNYFKTPIFYPAAEITGTEDKWIAENRVGDYVYFGTGDRAHPDRTDIVNGFYGIKNTWQWFKKDGTGTSTPNIVRAYVDKTTGQVKASDDNRVILESQRDVDGTFIEGVEANEHFILDNSENLIQNQEANEDVRTLITNYVKDALEHPYNAGWYFNLKETDGSEVGEKVVSSPVIYAGVIYFTTFIPEAESSAAAMAADPCANPGARGKGRLYRVRYLTGEAIVSDTLQGHPHSNRYQPLTSKGIPPEPVLVIHKDKPTVLVGFESSDVAVDESIKRFYWRQQ